MNSNFALFFAKPISPGLCCTQIHRCFRQKKSGDFEVELLAVGHRQLPQAKFGQTPSSVRHGKDCYLCPLYATQFHTVLASLKGAISDFHHCHKPIKIGM